MSLTAPIEPKSPEKLPVADPADLAAQEINGLVAREIMHQQAQQNFELLIGLGKQLPLALISRGKAAYEADKADHAGLNAYSIMLPMVTGLWSSRQHPAFLIGAKRDDNSLTTTALMLAPAWRPVENLPVVAGVGYEKDDASVRPPSVLMATISNGEYDSLRHQIHERRRAAGFNKPDFVPKPRRGIKDIWPPKSEKPLTLTSRADIRRLTAQNMVNVDLERFETTEGLVDLMSAFDKTDAALELVGARREQLAAAQTYLASLINKAIRPPAPL